MDFEEWWELGDPYGFVFNKNYKFHAKEAWEYQQKEIDLLKEQLADLENQIDEYKAKII